MRKILGSIAGAVALCGVAAAPASAVLVRFDIAEIGTLLAAGDTFFLEVADFEGFLLFDLIDTTEDGSFDSGALVDLQLKAFGPLSGTSPTSPGFELEFGLLPGDIELVQIPDGTPYQYPDPDDPAPPGDPPNLADGTAVDPTGELVPSPEVIDAERFVFDDGAELSVEGLPESGLASCTDNTMNGQFCFLAVVNIPGGLPLILSGPHAPIPVDDTANNPVFFDIVGLDEIETTPAALTGEFAFKLGNFDVRFPILDASGVIVPEPGAGLGVAASLGTLALLSRRRRRD